MDDVVTVPQKPGVPVDNDDVVVDDSEGGVTLLESNPKRKTALIVNTGDNVMRVTTDGSTPTATHGKPVSSGGGFLSLTSPYCPVGEVKAFSADPGTTANASEVI